MRFYWLMAIVVVLTIAGCARRPTDREEGAVAPRPVVTAPQDAVAEPPAEAGEEAAPEEAPAAAESARPLVELETDKGPIRVELYPQEAPKTVANFLRLVEDGFYDGTRFHRYEAGFVIQGGDPNSKDDDPDNDGQGGPGWTIPLEIAPGLRHTRGALGMARKGDPNSAGSQFYFCLEDAPHLDAGYCTFGRVVQGMDVVDQLRAGDEVTRARRLPTGEA